MECRICGKDFIPVDTSTTCTKCIEDLDSAEESSNIVEVNPTKRESKNGKLYAVTENGMIYVGVEEGNDLVNVLILLCQLDQSRTQVSANLVSPYGLAAATCHSITYGTIRNFKTQYKLEPNYLEDNEQIVDLYWKERAKNMAMKSSSIILPN